VKRESSTLLLKGQKPSQADLTPSVYISNKLIKRRLARTGWDYQPLGQGLLHLTVHRNSCFAEDSVPLVSQAGWEEGWCHPRWPCQGKTNGRAGVRPSLGSILGSAWGKQSWAQGPGVAKDLVACLLAATLVGCCEGIILASISFNLSCSFGPSLR